LIEPILDFLIVDDFHFLFDLSSGLLPQLSFLFAGHGSFLDVHDSLFWEFLLSERDD
jgi:hypothetical protein